MNSVVTSPKKQIKERQCVACKKTQSRDLMFRVLKQYHNQDLIINPGSKDFGRSFYLCKTSNCLTKFKKRNKKTLWQLTEKLESMI